MQLNELQQKQVEENMGLVGRVIKDNVKNVNMIGLFTYQDIFQIGCIGLSKAALDYKPGTSKFSTYAYIFIRNEIFNTLDYATIRRNREIISEIDVVMSLLAEGYSNREIGEMMGGVSANNITAWVSKARAYLKKDPNIMSYKEAL